MECVAGLLVLLLVCLYCGLRMECRHIYLWWHRHQIQERCLKLMKQIQKRAKLRFDFSMSGAILNMQKAMAKFLVSGKAKFT